VSVFDKFDREEPQSKSSSGGKYVVIGLIVLLAGLGVWYFTRDASETATGPTPAPTPAPPPSTTDIPEFEPLTGSLEVTANVAGATVYLDGEAVGEAPIRRDELPMGGHSGPSM